jgi:hypothetical protein
MGYLTGSLLIGVGATAIMDAWSLLRRWLIGIPLPDYGLVGRWIGHMARGRFRHDSIARARAIRGERLLGWTIHYATGVAFAAILLGIAGPEWLRHPALLPALAVGLATVAAPFLLMQPGMGAGIAASRTPRPAVARLQSVITHSVFGLGLYGAGWMLQGTSTYLFQ